MKVLFVLYPRIKELFIEVVNEAALVELFHDTVIDEILRLGAFGLRHGLFHDSENRFDAFLPRIGLLRLDLLDDDPVGFFGLILLFQLQKLPDQ